MTNCVVCGAATRRRATTCAACGADLENHRPINDSTRPDAIPVRRYGAAPPQAHGDAEHHRPFRDRARLLLLLLFGLLGAAALALGLSGLLR